MDLSSRFYLNSLIYGVWHQLIVLIEWNILTHIQDLSWNYSVKGLSHNIFLHYLLNLHIYSFLAWQSFPNPCNSICSNFGSDIRHICRCKNSECNLEIWMKPHTSRYLKTYHLYPNSILNLTLLEIQNAILQHISFLVFTTRISSHL